MTMFWVTLAILVIVGGVLLRNRRAVPTSEEEPWRASLDEDEPLDLEEIRRAEAEWSADAEGFDEPDDETWS